MKSYIDTILISVSGLYLAGMTNLGIKLEITTDEEGRSRFHGYSPSAFVMERLPVWYKGPWVNHTVMVGIFLSLREMLIISFSIVH